MQNINQTMYEIIINCIFVFMKKMVIPVNTDKWHMKMFSSQKRYCQEVIHFNHWYHWWVMVHCQAAFEWPSLRQHHKEHMVRIYKYFCARLLKAVSHSSLFDSLYGPVSLTIYRILRSVFCLPFR